VKDDKKKKGDKDEKEKPSMYSVNHNTQSSCQGLKMYMMQERNCSFLTGCKFLTDATEKVENFRFFPLHFFKWVLLALNHAFLNNSFCNF